MTVMIINNGKENQKGQQNCQILMLARYYSILTCGRKHPLPASRFAFFFRPSLDAPQTH